MKSFRKNFKVQDIYYTPKILVDILKPYLDKYVPKDSVILCPFDTGKSEYVKVLRDELGYTVKFGDITTGQDFFEHDYGDYDIVISNPPFSRKKRNISKIICSRKTFYFIR